MSFDELQSVNGMNEPIYEIWKQIREQFKFGERNEDREELRRAVLDKMQKPAIAAAILHQVCVFDSVSFLIWHKNQICLK